MAKKKWWQTLLVVLSFGAAKFADGTLGSGRKTAEAGKVAGDIIDTVAKATNDSNE